MAFGWDNTTGGGYQYGYSTTIQTSAGTTQPYYIVPAPTAPEPAIDDSPLGWLRSQVSEITELAHAA